jgi:hypothetical protein
METLTTIVGLGVVFFLVVRSFRRRAKMTPEERQAERLQRDVRDLKREVRRQRWD